MKTLDSALKDLFETALKSAFSLTSPPLDLKQTNDPKFGHYQFNSAMRLAKELGQNPRAIATQIVENLPESDLIKKVEIAGPGFLNITLTNKALEERVEKMLSDERLAIPKEETQRIIVDFSSPNTAKEMHVGHLRSTIIGDALARVFHFMGHDVLRLNHIGDWGTAFGMLIAFLEEEQPEVLAGIQSATLTDLVGWYRASKKRFDEEPIFKKRAQKQVVKLQGGDESSLRAWKILCAISSAAYQEIYDLLDVELIERGESFYNPQLPAIVDELTQSGLAVESNGAKCIFVEGYKNRDGDPLPLMIQKSDGGYGYATTDMAAIKQRTFEEKADRIIYVTDLGQATHFNMVFKAAEKAGWIKENAPRVDHVGFGLVLGADGKKFRTRSGDTERLIDLLNEAVARATKAIEEKNPNLPKEEIPQIAQAIGIGAVKYADLSTNRTGDYQFSYDKMLRFEGNTAAYLLYSFVRVKGIKRKTNASKESLIGPVTLSHPAEIALALHLCRFGEALQKVEEELMPNRLTDYLYGLAEKFHIFFHDCRVEGAEEEQSRLRLCEAVARTMKLGLGLLGVDTVERM